MITYKIVEKVEGGYKNLKHARRRIFHDGDVLIAEKRMVYEDYDDQGNKKLYLSGIHVIESEELCFSYLNRFKDQSNKTVIKCDAQNCRKKPNKGKGVLLADLVRVICEIN